MAPKTALHTVYKNDDLVSFYSNVSHNAPQTSIDYGSTHGFTCVHGLASLYQYTEKCYLHRKEFQVHAIVVVYVLLMNFVDLHDQMHATKPAQRREKRKCMLIFTFELKVGLQNAFVVMKGLNVGDLINCLDAFKRHVA